MTEAQLAADGGAMDKIDQPAPVEGQVVADDGKEADAGAISPDTGSDTGEKAALPENWREMFAGGNEDYAKRISRHATPHSIVKALIETQDKLRSSRIKRDMPDPSDEKAMAEWRKSEGIPDDATGYEFPQEIQSRMSDEDKPILASFTEFAHSKNLPPAAVQTAAEWYVDMQEQALVERSEQDKKAKSDAEEALRDEWGNGDYKPNLTLGIRYLQGIPGIGEDFAELRKPDGSLLGSDPAFVAWAAEQGRMKFGDVTFSSSDSETRHSARKTEIEKIRDTDFDRYEREGLGKEYKAILEKELKRGK